MDKFQQEDRFWVDPSSGTRKRLNFRRDLPRPIRNSNLAIGKLYEQVSLYLRSKDAFPKDAYLAGRNGVLWLVVNDVPTRLFRAIVAEELGGVGIEQDFDNPHEFGIDRQVALHIQDLTVQAASSRE